MSEANKDECLKCISIANRALAEQDLEKAAKFASKARHLYDCREVQELHRRIDQTRSGPSDRPHASQNQAAGGTPSHGSQQRPHATRDTNSHGSSTSTSGPAGMGGSRRQGASESSGVRKRHESKPVVDENAGTSEQRALVRDILKAGSDLYAILSLPKSASDDDIKRAYRKLALKLHPDKNQAARADEAFKAISKAFSCLSDPDKRAYYDRTGFESSSAAAAAAASQRSPGGRAAGGFGGPGVYQEDFDPDQIFNMFFGGGFGRPQAHVFRTHFGPGFRHRQHQQQQQQQAQQEQQRSPAQATLMGIMQFMPVILLLLFSFFSATTPSYSLNQTSHYIDQVLTDRLQVPFFVKSKYEFERTYPRRSASRVQLERQIESDYYDRLAQRCNQERVTKQRLMYSWSHRDEARKMKLPSCEEYEQINVRLRSLNNQPVR